jgi:hypothetical protein
VDRRRFLIIAASALLLTATPMTSAATIDPQTRTVTSGPFVIRWNQDNPEAIAYLSWNGSASLTNPWVHPNCPDGGPHEFFGNSWGMSADSSFTSSPVGWGSTGLWSTHGTTGVDVDAAASDCPGADGIEVDTSYGFFGATPSTGRIQVERRFFFGDTPFASDLRPYIPRLYPLDAFTEVRFPNAAGTALVTRHGSDCGLGCRIIDWNGTWFAIHDPGSGRGLVVRHEPSTHPVALWIDEDGGSYTNATSVALLQTGSGFTGTIVDRQIICFYDSTIWTPSLALPAGCAAAWAEAAPVALAKAGLSSAPGAFRTATTLASLSRYVTWQGSFTSAAAGRNVGVLVATRKADGTWTPFARVTSRVANQFGVVVYSRREASPAWISVRFGLDSALSTASQARWR